MWVTKETLRWSNQCRSGSLGLSHMDMMMMMMFHTIKVRGGKITEDGKKIAEF